MATARATLAALPAGPAAANRVARSLPKCVDREARISAPTINALVPGGSHAGQPLDPPVHDYFRARLGVDPGSVRVTPNNPAVGALGARAMTLGRHIAFAPGEFRPDTPSGLGLIGHEIAHSVQQSRGSDAPAGRPGGAAEHEAERVSAMILRGQNARVGMAAGIAPAFSLRDYQQSLPGGFDDHISALSVSELRTDIAEISEYLDAQYAGTEETDRLFAIRDKLVARRDTLIKSANVDPPRPKGAGKRGRKGSKAAATAALPPVTIDQVPRILRDRASTPLTDPDEIKHEVDVIVAYLRRPDTTKDERDILRTELQVLSPQFEQVLQQDTATRQARRVQAAFADAGEGADGLRKKIAIIEGIYGDPAEPLAAFIRSGNERIRINMEQAKDLRAKAEKSLRTAVDRAKSTADSARGLYSAQTKVNDDHPIVSTISGWLGGVDDPGMAMAIAGGVLTASATRAAAELDAGRLSGAVDPVVMASTMARKMEMAVYAWHTGLISGAETAVTGLTFVRDAAFAIDIAIGAVIAAPFVAGAVGAGGLGLTGVAASGTTVVGTGLMVGSGAGVAGGILEYSGQRLAGADHDTALAAANQQADRRFKEGVAAGAGGATTRVMGQALGPASTAAGQLGTRLMSQGAGNFVGGAAQAKLNGADLDTALLQGGKSAALGSVGTVAGAPFANGSLLQSTVSVGTSLGVNYLDVRARGGTNAEALQATAINLATIGALHASPSIQKQQAGFEESGRKFGTSVRKTTAGATRTFGNYARAGALGLSLSSPPTFRTGAGPSPSTITQTVGGQVDARGAGPPAQVQAEQAVAPVRTESTGARATARASSSAQASIAEQARMGFLDPRLAEPGAAVATATSRTARSQVTAIRAQTAELSAYDARLARGEIGILAPSGSNVPGADYATAVRRPDGTFEIVVTDAKSRVGTRAFGKVGGTLKPTWRAAVAAALAADRFDIGDPTTEQAIRDAWAQGRIRIARDTIDFNPDAQGERLNLDN